VPDGEGVVYLVLLHVAQVSWCCRSSVRDQGALQDVGSLFERPICLKAPSGARPPARVVMRRLRWKRNIIKRACAGMGTGFYTFAPLNLVNHLLNALAKGQSSTTTKCYLTRSLLKTTHDQPLSTLDSPLIYHKCRIHSSALFRSFALTSSDLAAHALDIEANDQSSMLFWHK
jgi:hypothetical protein